MSSCFEVLRLPTDATRDQIRARWRELAMKHHPDRGGDPAEFHRLRQAYQAACKQANEPMRCKQCKGRGTLSHTRGFNTVRTPCPFCGGKGVTLPTGL